GRIQKAITEISAFSLHCEKHWEKMESTGTVLVKARRGRPRKIWNKQKRRMLRTIRVNPETSTKDLQHDLAADGVTVHRSTIRRTLHKEMLYGRVMQRKPFLRPHHKQRRLSTGTGNLVKVEGRMDSNQYQQTLETNGISDKAEAAPGLDLPTRQRP
ncbi:hypothetical protein NFI96_017964, partial [Prochilodus magdalenae]